ncbi:hypothetical protein JYT44_03035 [Caldithrix abyssi]|nr:hypothetical protein [Caldithrix abyssi]
MIELFFLAGLLGGMLGSASRGSSSSNKSSSTDENNQTKNLYDLQNMDFLDHYKTPDWTDYREDRITGDYWKHHFEIKIED